ncbi:hypothetical protein H2199_000259 [Coniosporium tulheliwenetii]|uniref:Uncharacterized protein n=1 Tax=Coniosporium tulheliwenetii TaxID=3383036 RepID=A0ACC2ZPL4_9PEZI|nr:hypothetical protein H2199_000259 [Cladosporium sp. JES 115]
MAEAQPPGKSDAKKAWYRDKRRAKFAASEAAKAPEDRLISRTDFDDFVVSQVSAAHEQSMQQVREWFMEFLTDEHVQLCSDRAQAAKYFSKNGTAWTPSVIRMFLEWLVDSRSGSIDPEGRLCFTTLRCYLRVFVSAARRSQNPVDKEVLTSCYDWITGPLISQGRLNMDVRKKPVAMTKDVTGLLEVLYSREYMAVFRTTREILYTSLFINLAVDCCGRIGEILRGGHKKANPTKYLRWSHVKLYAFNEDGKTVLRALVAFSNLKSATIETNKTKTIPLRLLPLHMTAQDTLRQLVILGLIDGVFENVRCWADFDNLDPGEHSTLIKMSDSEMLKPVFRRVDAHSVNDEPLKTQWVATRLKCLGRACGFEGNVLSYCIRRGIAYLLSINVSKDDRLALMGHKDGDSVYWTHYRNTTSTIDWQALARNVEVQDVAMLSAMSLNKRENAPTRLSPAGFKLCYQDPELIGLIKLQSEALDQVILAHGSLAKAKGTTLYAQYQRASLAMRSRKDFLFRTRFAEEYRAFFAGDCPSKTSTDAIETPDDSNEALDSGTPAVLTENDDDYSPLISGDDDDDDDGPTESNIDPRLLLDESANCMEAFFKEAATADAEGETAKSSAPAAPGQGDEDMDDDELDVVYARRPQVGHAKERIMPITLVDDITDMVWGRGDPKTSVEISDRLVVAFNHLHGIDVFHPGHEPPPGTWNCRFCGELLPKKPQVHVRACEKKVLLEYSNKLLEERFPTNITCTWTNTRGKLCGRNGFPHAAKLGEHVTNHLRHFKKGTYPCRFGACVDADEPVVFQSGPAFYNHLALHHSISIACRKDKPEVRNATQHIEWCGLCFRWMSQLTEDLDQHAAGHAALVQQIVSEDGYAGMKLSEKLLLPPTCIFCVHNHTLEPSQRFKAYSTIDSLFKHITQVHIEGLERHKHCPASQADTTGTIQPTCDQTQRMTKGQLIEHLENDHDIKAWVKKTPRQKDTTTPTPDDDDDDEQRDQPAQKKRKTVKKQGILAPKSVNANVSLAIRSAIVAKTTDQLDGAADLDENGE